MCVERGLILPACCRCLKYTARKAHEDSLGDVHTSKETPLQCRRCQLWFHDECDKEIARSHWFDGEAKCSDCADEFILPCGCVTKKHSAAYESHVACIDCGHLMCPQKVKNVDTGICDVCRFERDCPSD